MRISPLASNPALSALMQPRASFDASSILPPSTAKSSASLSVLPPSAATPLSFANILQLQMIDEAPEPTKIQAKSAEDIFLEEAQKSPAERMRDQILNDLGMSEESLAQLPPDERRAVEDKIRQLIEEKFRQAMGADGKKPDEGAARAVIAEAA